MDHPARLVSFHATFPQAPEVNGNRWNVCAGSLLVLTSAHLSLKFGSYMCFILLLMLWTSVIALLLMKCSILALQFLRCVSRTFLAVILSHQSMDTAMLRKLPMKSKLSFLTKQGVK
jgi:hypothetical protein